MNHRAHIDPKHALNQHRIQHDAVVALYDDQPCIQTTIVLRTPLVDGSPLHQAMTGQRPLDFENNHHMLERINRQIEADLGDTFESDIESIYSKLVPAPRPKRRADTP